MKGMSRPAAAFAGAVLLATGAAGAMLAAGPPMAVTAQELQEQPGPSDRRALIEALAGLANLSPRELRAEAERHGGVLQALEAHGVGESAVLAELIRLSRGSLQPAVEQGRLSDAQAGQLAERQAQRLLQRLKQATPGRRR